jgi:hypothetical protein
MIRKLCTGCHVEKRFSAFYRHPSGRDGYASKCKLCVRAMVAANRELKRDAENAAQRERYRTDAAFRAYRLAYHAKYRKTAAGLESRRVSQRIYRAWRKATGAQPWPSDRPEAVRERNRRYAERRALTDARATVANDALRSDR